MLDLLIKNPEIVDGSGNPSYKSNIGIINNQLDNLAVEFFSDLSQLSYVKIQSIKTLSTSSPPK